MSSLLKKNSKFTIIEHSKFPILNIKNEVLMFKAEWLLDTSRQDNNTTHKDTMMYQCIYFSYSWQPGDKIEKNIINSLKNNKSIKELNNIFKYLENFYCGNVVRVEFVKMSPNTKIRKHVDGGSFLHYARRCHIPILTNSDIFFSVLDNKINMKEGVIYEINNSMPHSVENNSNLERIHLIIDILPKEYTDL